MIIVLKSGATEAEIEQVIEKIEAIGLKSHVSKGVERTVIGAIGDEAALRELPLQLLPGVEQVLPITKPYKLVSREFRKEDTVVDVRGVPVGGRKIAVIAGPCAIEGREMLLETADKVKEAGAVLLRGGAFKPRTSPYSFQGLKEDGLRFLAEAREKTGLPVVTEIMDPRDAELLDRYADIIQVGARNMQNFSLLKEVGLLKKPVMLKRGLSSTIKDLLLSAEYIASNGNSDIILCERGVRTFETFTRNMIDIAAVPSMKHFSHLPVIVDPSHAAGRWDLIHPMSLAALASGADGLMIEVHPSPENALCDGPQSLHPERFSNLMNDLRQMAGFLDREI